MYDTHTVPVIIDEPLEYASCELCSEKLHRTGPWTGWRNAQEEQHCTYAYRHRAHT